MVVNGVARAAVDEAECISISLPAEKEICLIPKNKEGEQRTKKGSKQRRGKVYTLDIAGNLGGNLGTSLNK